MRSLQLAGLVLACGGLVGLLLPGLSAPPLAGALLMLGAGIAWGVYSLRGKRGGDPLKITAGNFVRAVPMALVLSLLLFARTSPDPAGIGYAFLSGALTSGVGYAIWYAALPSLKSTTAATVQLSVPILAAAGGVFFLGEPVTWRLLVASVAIIGGIALVILAGERRGRPDAHPVVAGGSRLKPRRPARDGRCGDSRFRHTSAGPGHLISHGSRGKLAPGDKGDA